MLFNEGVASSRVYQGEPNRSNISDFELRNYRRLAMQVEPSNIFPSWSLAKQEGYVPPPLEVVALGTGTEGASWVNPVPFCWVHYQVQMSTLPPPFDSGEDAITEITVMADYGACLWDQDDAAFELSLVGGPDTLSKRIDAWEQYFWLQRDDPAAFDPVEFEVEGRLIASEVKRFAGSDIRVRYRDLNRDSIDVEG